jgi:hypothetical protein
VVTSDDQCCVGLVASWIALKNYVQNQFQKTRLHFLKTHIISVEEVGKKETYFSSLCVQYV